MAAAAKKTKMFVVVPANGQQVRVEGTHAVEDTERSSVKIMDGDDTVASFRGYTSFYPEGADATPSS